MREKINQIANDKFEYRDSSVLVNPGNLVLSVEKGQEGKSSFVISNQRHWMMKGVVTTDCPYMTIEEDAFSGIEKEVTISFRCDHLQPGEVVKGSIQIISDCGNRTVPFVISVTMPSMEAPNGQINDLYHFLALAKDNADEAVKLFSNPRFVEVFLALDEQAGTLYHDLMRGTQQEPQHYSIAMEEFLIAMHKKLPIQISVGQTQKRYDNCVEAFGDKVDITKDNWGYQVITVSSDADFVKPEHTRIVSTDFVGNQFALQYRILPEKMTAGKNYAKISLTTVYQTIDIMIIAMKPGMDLAALGDHRRWQRAVYQLMRRTLEYRMGNLPTQDYVEDVKRLLRGGFAQDSLVKGLYQLEMAVLENDHKKADRLLDELEPRISVLYRQKPDLYGAFYYHKACYQTDKKIINECVSQIRDTYHQFPNQWILLWYLLQIDSDFRNDRMKLKALNAQLSQGCYSPVLYQQACLIYNENPNLLVELTPVTGRVLHWGTKKNYLNKAVALRYVYLVGKEKQYHKIYETDMAMLYQQFQDDEMLTTVCKVLMKGQITTPEAFYWYEKGISHNLKITDLYEYYMYSFDESQDDTIDRSVLLYFQYDNHLTSPKKAMLYTYIIRNKLSDPDTYNLYREMMEEFALQQLKQSRISENLAVLYEEFLNEETLQPEYVKSFIDVMFCHRITCHNPRIKGVYVSHPELAQEEYFPLRKQEALVPVYTDSARIYLADADDNRYVSSIDYTSNQILRLTNLAEHCYRYQKSDIRLLLYLIHKQEHLSYQSGQLQEMRREILEQEGLSKTYRQKIFSGLVHYYFHTNQKDLLSALLTQIDWKQVFPQDRLKFIEYCSMQNKYEKAMQGVQYYGYERVEPQQLLTISEQTFVHHLDREEPALIKLAWHLFLQGLSNEATICYLIRFFSGTVAQLIAIWKKANELGMEAKSLQERLLAQVVFSGEVPQEVFEVYESYFRTGQNRQIIRSFQKKMAYDYLLKNRELPEEMFENYYKDVRIKENLPCMLALLKHLSLKEELTEEEITFADYHLNRLYDQKIVFPFYRNFYGKFPLPVHITDEYYVQYAADPTCEVTIHYRIYAEHGTNKGKYKTEKMRDVFEGIRVKEFVLFQDEILEYFITEHTLDGDVKTSVNRTKMDCGKGDARTSPRYQCLNQMMTAKNNEQKEPLLDCMEAYAKEVALSHSLFKPM